MIAVRFIRIFLLSSKCYSDDFVFSHEEFRVRLALPEVFEVIGGHVIEGEDVKVFETSEEGVDFVDDEFFVLSGFGLDLGKGNEFVSFGLGHQQLNIRIPITIIINISSQS